MPMPTSFIKNQSSRRLLPLFVLAACSLGALQLPPPTTGREEPKRLPDGRLWSEAFIKSNYEANLKDLARMRKILDSVQEEMEKTQGHVLSLKALKDLEELERLSRRVRDRMRRH